MLKTEERLWVTEIDAAIITFPQKVISQLVTRFLFLQDFAFDCTLIPCNTHGKKNHEVLDIKSYVTVSPQELVVTRYHDEWINVPLLPKLNNYDYDLKLYLEVSGDNYCTLRLAKNTTQYRTFIMNNGKPHFITTYYHAHDIYPGKSMITMKRDSNILFITMLGKNCEILRKKFYCYQKGTSAQCDTLLIGVGYLPQAVKILPCPLENDPIWDKIERHHENESGCNCDGCHISLTRATACVECERGNIEMK
jgi:hypothetical protein